MQAGMQACEVGYSGNGLPDLSHSIRLSNGFVGRSKRSSSIAHLASSSTHRLWLKQGEDDGRFQAASDIRYSKAAVTAKL